MRYQAMTGLTDGQLTELTSRVSKIIGTLTSTGRPYALGLYRSVALVVTLMRKNATQDTVGAFFGVSQPTVSRRWDLPRPAIAETLAELAMDPKHVVGEGTLLVDGTICPTWDWRAFPDLYSGKAGYPGMNVQVAVTLGGTMAAIGATPVHRARHDAHAYAASGPTQALAGLHTVADLGYVDVEGITVTPIRKAPGPPTHQTHAEFNTQLSKIRATVEHAIAHLKAR